MTDQYSMCDSGICGPALSLPVSLDFIRSRPDAVLDMMNLAELSGYTRGLKAGREIFNDTIGSLMDAKLATADAATDAKALDPMLADMGLDQRQREFIGSHDDLQPVRKGEADGR